MRELREFRGAFPDFERAGIALAGVSADTPESHQRWVARLRLPYPLLSDPARSAGHALGLVRRLGIGGWSIDLFRRATLLADADGVIVAAWTAVRMRGHAAEVLAAARTLGPGPGEHGRVTGRAPAPAGPATPAGPSPPSG